MSKLSLLRERLGPPVRALGGSPVSSGSDAHYVLYSEAPIAKSISAIWALVRRHVPLLEAKRAIEEVMVGNEVAIDVPMLEDQATFEGELREFGVRAVRELPIAAEG